MISMISGFPFTPIISFIFSFFILSILDFLADLLSTTISVDKILFISLVGILRIFVTILLLWDTALCKLLYGGSLPVCLG